MIVKSVILYMRVSTKEQGDSRNGLEAQRIDLINFCERMGLEVVREFEEVVSGKHDLDRRPQLRHALKLAEKRKNCAVLVSKLDRLSRDAAFIFNLMKTNYQFVVAELGIDVGPLMIHMHAVIAEDERRRIGERTKAALTRVRARGVKLGGITKNHDMAVAKSVATNKAEADSFAEHVKPVIARMRRDGMSVNAIAQELNEQGNKTARGGKWYAKTVCNVMCRLNIQ